MVRHLIEGPELLNRWDRPVVINTPDPKHVANILHHLCNRSETILILRVLVVQEELREQLDGAEDHLGHMVGEGGVAGGEVSVH